MRDKIAVVTGASRGIGRAIAQRLALDLPLVAVHYNRNFEAASTVVHEIEIKGGNAFAIPADVSSLDSIREFYSLLDSELIKRTGRNEFDVLVNNAGMGEPGTIAGTTEEHFDLLFSVNTKGPFFMAQLALSRLRRGGRIINISSTASRRPSPQYAPYSMTKAALDVLTVVLAAELGERSITVNTIAPGYTATDVHKQELKDPQREKLLSSMVALRRIGQVDDIARVAAFLASPESGWITGQYIEASGGFGL